MAALRVLILHPGRLGLVLGVLLLIALAAGWLTGGTAQASGPSMTLRIAAGGTCDHPTAPSKCEVATGDTFDLEVQASAPPSGGFIGFQTVVVRNDIAYKGGVDCENEVVMQPLGLCLGPALLRGGHIGHGGLTALGASPPISTSTVLVRIPLTCHSIGEHEVALVAENDAPNTQPLSSVYKDANDNTIVVKAVATRSIIVGSLEDPDESVLVEAEIASALTINCVEPPPRTPTATPTLTPPPTPTPQTKPALANLFLTRQGLKVPPLECLSGGDEVALRQAPGAPITSQDPKDPTQLQRLGAFEFEVHYDHQKVCVEVVPEAAARSMSCFIDDAATKPSLEGVARIGCVTLGKDIPLVDGNWDFFGDFGVAGTVSCTLLLVELTLATLTAEGLCTSLSPVLDVGLIQFEGEYDGASGEWSATIPCSICAFDPEMSGTFDVPGGTFAGAIGPIVSQDLPQFASFSATKLDDGLPLPPRPLAELIVRPQPDVYSQAKANQDNGVVVQLLNQKCALADLQGHPIPHLSCDDADVTIRYLEGDAEPDCTVDALDTQAMGFRWGATKGTLFYLDRHNLEPSGTQADGDIDIKDLQFVYGRLGSTCGDPHPAQEPANPKV